MVNRLLECAFQLFMNKTKVTSILTFIFTLENFHHKLSVGGDNVRHLSVDPYPQEFDC